MDDWALQISCLFICQSCHSVSRMTTTFFDSHGKFFQHWRPLRGRSFTGCMTIRIGSIELFSLCCYSCFVFCFLKPFCFCLSSPWYNHTRWLGVKHQLTYLLVCIWRQQQQPWEWRWWRWRCKTCDVTRTRAGFSHCVLWIGQQWGSRRRNG